MNLVQQDRPQQNSTSPVPSWNVKKLARLQNVDAAIKRPIHNHAIGRTSTPKQKKVDTCEVKQLLKQWVVCSIAAAQTTMATSTYSYSCLPVSVMNSWRVSLISVAIREQNEQGS